MIKSLIAAGVVVGAALFSTVASAATIYADSVISYFDSGAGPVAGPYGGTWSPSVYPVSVPLSYAVDGDANTFVSLPTGSYMVVGFSSGVVYDGAGNDIFISEPGQGYEDANIFVSDDWGASFTFLGVAHGNTLTELDLADIGYAGFVNAVAVVGLDNGGGSPGFDLAFVQGLEGSVIPEVPLPAAFPLMAFGAGLLGFGARRRRAA